MPGSPFQLLARSRRGFTLVEMLVVIGIVALLIGLSLGGIMIARNSAKKTALNFQLQSVATALEAYKQDLKMYPPVALGVSTSNDVGAFTLCRALLGPAPATLDGKDSYGFKMNGIGKTYGAYLQPDNFRIAYITGPESFSPEGTVFSDPAYAKLVMIDQSNRPILYGPARTAKPKFSNANAYLAARGSAAAANDVVFFDLDNIVGRNDATDLADYRSMIRQRSEADDLGVIGRLQVALGDTNQNKKLDAGETLNFSSGFLLWSAGLDGIFGEVAGKNADDLLITDAGQ